ncbi:MAG: hypothetical protein IJJ33_03505 [Victivallales bacterium]|nr:hypothetical protein [Victivallales bacterium]
MPDDSDILQEYANGIWGFAYVHSRCEKRVLESLTQSGVPCYLPTVAKARMHHGTKVVTRVPMFSGYLFLCASLASASELRRNDKGIVRIFLLQEKLAELQLLSELKTLKRLEEEAKDNPVYVNPDIVSGDKVLITNGSMKGLEVDVVRRDDEHDSIIVNLTILEQHVDWPISAELLKKLIV